MINVIIYYINCGTNNEVMVQNRQVNKQVDVCYLKAMQRYIGVKIVSSNQTLSDQYMKYLSKLFIQKIYLEWTKEFDFSKHYNKGKFNVAYMECRQHNFNTILRSEELYKLIIIWLIEV